MSKPTSLDRFNVSRRDLIKTSTGAAAGMALAGGLAASPSIDSVAAQDSGTALQLGRESEFAAIFAPYHISTGGQTQVMDLIYSRLLKVRDDLSFEPDLAESWEVNEDATVYTFQIREGVTWTDGEPLTIDDIIFTYKTALIPETAASQAGKLRQIKGATAFYDGEADEIEGLERVDDTTLRITLEQPNVAFLTGTAGSSTLIWVLPEHIFSGVDLANIDQAPESLAPTVGSGAYQFVEYVPDQYVSFTANPNYHLGAPKIEQVFLRLAEPATQLAQLESGEIHLLSRMAPKEAARLEGNETVTVISTQGVGVFQTAVNNERFPDKRLRQAMMYGTDRNALLEAVLLGQGELVFSTVIGPEWAVFDDLNTYDFDPEKARALLEEMAWDSEQSIELTWSKGSQTVELAAPVFQQQMADIGIKIELAPFESAAYVDKVVNDPDFDMAWFGGGSYRLDPDVSSNYYMTVNWTPNGGNTTHYSNEELDQLFLDGRATSDIDTRREIYHQVALILNEDVPTSSGGRTIRSSGSIASCRDCCPDRTSTSGGTSRTGASPNSFPATRCRHSGGSALISLVQTLRSGQPWVGTFFVVSLYRFQCSFSSRSSHLPWSIWPREIRSRR
ncbi:MAG: ABC transporter substrate-binding protein [Thermomicrobiales bacterium]|nr:ABC transporter substrate-binding protein [Thermomicrobiales bacterium]